MIINRQIILQEEIRTNEITVLRTIDDVINSHIYCYILIGNIERMVTLWEGSDYGLAGQWTDTDVENRLNEVL